MALAHAGLSEAADGSADLRANSQGTGFVVTVGAGHVQLMIVIDCLASLMILSKLGQ